MRGLEIGVNMRPFLIALFGVLPSLTFFWWMLHDCRFILFSPTIPVAVYPNLILLWNAAVFGLFGLIHSTLAEAGISRLLYLVVAGLTSLTVIVFWQPLDGVLWKLADAQMMWYYGTSQFLVWLVLHGWIIQQMGIAEFLGFREPVKRLVTSGPYAYCRHPMHANILGSLLLTPTMTTDRLTMLIAVGLYLAVAIPLEEARLEEQFGEDWRAYRARTPLLF